ncbi:MAG TPA: NAD(P)-dependent oxidoreductase [Solirubrobacterales bacterium]|nr:NAD(P)-dependent oxidoreductase [Solirubrobacterales bacterium]
MSEAESGTRSPTIGLVGLGRMGGNMAARFLDAGYVVHGTARSRERAAWLVEKGMRWAENAREIAGVVDFALTSLPDDEAVELVAGGPDGLLAGLEAGKVWIDLSTISPRVSRELAARAAETGGRMLDAPVSGSVPQVQSGTLTIMVGGDEAAYERVEPILRLLGSPTRIGANGQGLALKLAINISLAVQMLAFSEGLLLAERDGVPLDLAAGVMSESPIGSPMLKARVPLLLDLPEEAWFDVGLMRKDIGLALVMAEELGAAAPSAGVAHDVLSKAVDQGFEHRDIAALLPTLERLSR